MDRRGPDIHRDIIGDAHHGCGALVDVREAARIAVPQDTDAALPVSNGDLAVVGVPASDGVVNDRAVEYAVNDDVPSRAWTLHTDLLEVGVVARLAMQAERGSSAGSSVDAVDSGPATVNTWADAILTMVAVAISNTAAHLDGAIGNGHKTIGVGGGAVGVASGVVDRRGPDIVR